MKTKFIAICYLLFAIYFSTYAQGTAFTYQGRLNNNGSPANGSYDVTFALFNTNAGGVAIAGPVTNSTVVVSNGLFTTLIDFGNAFNGSSNWLEIAVRTNGSGTFNRLIPRQPVTPTPYAITAENVAGAITVQNNTNGAPNIIGGSSVNYVGNGVVGATIAGGGSANDFGTVESNSVTANFGTVSGGSANTASGPGASISGGYGNVAGGTDATVGGGEFNSALFQAATVSGGIENTASAVTATVGGGNGNIASGISATVPGGAVNTAGGVASFAAGLGAQAIHDNSFVWNDNENTFSSTANQQFAVHAAGGVRLVGDVTTGNISLTENSGYHNLSMSGGNSTGYLYGAYPRWGDGIHLGYNFYADNAFVGHIVNTGGGTSRITAGYGEIVLAVGDVNTAPGTVRLDATTGGVTVFGTFNNSSDRNVKQDFAPVSSSQILDKVLRLPVSEWSYKEDAITRHIGPMGQDFYSVFNIGTDDKHIAPIDEGGIAFAAIQGLNKKLETETKTKDGEIQTLKQQNDSLNKRLSELEVMVKSLKHIQ